MKKIIACLLALLLLFSVAAAEDTKEETTVPTNQLTVGNPTPMRGEFFTGLWGNSTSDLDVRDLLHGYNLVMWDSAIGGFTVDPSVVSNMKTDDTQEGKRSYMLRLKKDLQYSDGTAITAWDYAFSFLFTLSKEAADLGAYVLRRDQFMGYAQYCAGKSKVLTGVRVYSDDVLEIIINEKYVPFFYELGLLSCNPYPISVIAPGVVVKDDGRGVYLANEDETIQEPIFTTELLKKTVFDPETGYLSHPSVVSGPYTLTSWDGVTAEFEINPYYKGNSKGEKPSIQKLVYTLAKNDTQIEDLKSGKFGLLNKVLRGDAITAGLELTSEGDFAVTDYPRTGLCYIAFTCEKPTVSSDAVRRAIAWCMDRDQLTKDYTESYGVTVDGYFGIGQWMYLLATGGMEPPVEEPWDKTDEKEVAAYNYKLSQYAEQNLDNLIHYTVDTEKAIQILEDDGWVLNENGLRQKGDVVLDLKMIYPEGNNIVEYLKENFLDNLETVGIKLTLEEMPMVQLLSQWYEQEERTADMIYMASNFDLVFDPNAYFDNNGCWSHTNMFDWTLRQYAQSMSSTKPGDALTYLRYWIKFEERFNKLLPMIPIYGNTYYDFYTNALTDYHIDQNVTWGQAIVPAELD